MNTLVRNFQNGLLNEILNENTKSKALANIIESNDDFKIELAVPGFKKEDFKIEVQNRSLSIAGSKPQAEESKNNFVRKEFAVDNFERVFKLPILVETDQIEAVYEDGILTLSIPKKEEAKPKEQRLISIN